jgi:hypothetical protein
MLLPLPYGGYKLTKGKIKIKKIGNVRLDYILLFLFVIDFFNKSGYIFLFLLLYVFFKYLACRKRFVITTEFIVICLFSFTYFIMYSIHFSIYIQTIVYYFIGPIGAYYIGKSIISNSNIEKSLFKVTMIIVIGLFINGVLNMYITFTSGVIRFPSEYIIDYWTNEPIARTLQGLYLTPIACTLFATLFLKDKICNNYIRLLLVIGSLFAIWSTFMLANRSLIIISIITFCFSILLLFFQEKKPYFGINFLRLSIYGTILSLILLFDIFHIRTFIFNSPLIARLNSLNMTMLETSRYERYIAFIQNFIYYPFGGREMEIDGGHFAYTHNVWLDIYVDVGIIPFLWFATYTTLIFRSLIHFIRLNSSTFLRYVIIAVYCAFMLTFCVEPVIEANPYYVMMFFIINGSISRFLFEVYKEKRSINISK